MLEACLSAEAGAPLRPEGANAGWIVSSTTLVLRNGPPLKKRGAGVPTAASRTGFAARLRAGAVARRALYAGQHRAGVRFLQYQQVQ